MKKKQYESIVTPKGIAIYPHLIQPDTKYNALGDYKVSLSVSEDESAPLIGKINAEIERLKLEAPKNKKLKLNEPPFTAELDDEGQETGRIIFKFKRKAKVTLPDGKTLEFSPKLFDAEGSLAEGVESIWGGSELRVSADLIPYSMPTGSGVSLRLKAVQIIKLVEGSGGSAGQFGFEATDGYVAPKVEEVQEEVVAYADEEEDF